MKQKQYNKCNGCTNEECNGFERVLITKGKNKGTYIITEYYRCKIGIDKCNKVAQNCN